MLIRLSHWAVREGTPSIHRLVRAELRRGFHDGGVGRVAIPGELDDRSLEADPHLMDKSPPAPSVMPLNRTGWKRELHLSNFINSYFQYRDVRRCGDVRKLLIIGRGLGSTLRYSSRADTT
jgi:hypothetical protein